MKKSTIVILVVCIMLLLAAISSYNGIVSKAEEVDNTLAIIDTQLQRRSDLIPNLVSTVKGYIQHEEKILQLITDAREQLANANTITEKAEANDGLTSALNNFMLIVENYPDLESSQNFIQLSDELAGTENRIATARRDYNEAVKEYNSTIKKFPTKLMANIFGFETKEYFEASEESKEVPDVQF